MERLLELSCRGGSAGDVSLWDFNVLLGLGGKLGGYKRNRLNHIAEICTYHEFYHTHAHARTHTHTPAKSFIYKVILLLLGSILLAIKIRSSCFAWMASLSLFSGWSMVWPTMELILSLSLLYSRSESAEEESDAQTWHRTRVAWSYLSNVLPTKSPLLPISNSGKYSATKTDRARTIF